MNIHCFQHIAFETPGTILDWAKQNNHAVTYTYFFAEGYLIPSLNNIDLLIIMGGFMNVEEEEKFPFLIEEKQFIKRAIEAGKKVIGICLGSQLIAAALGSNVYQSKEKEIGFFPITFTDAALQHPLFNHFSKEYTVFHWHGDTFDLPANAQLIASTSVCKHQAYLIGSNVMGLQFHFEMNEEVIEQMLLHDGHELDEKGPCIQTREQIRDSYRQFHQNKKDVALLLDKFLSIA